jgi:hypothetical protein
MAKAKRKQQIEAIPAETPTPEHLAKGNVKSLFVTHVETNTITKAHRVSSIVDLRNLPVLQSTGAWNDGKRGASSATLRPAMSPPLALVATWCETSNCATSWTGSVNISTRRIGVYSRTWFAGVNLPVRLAVCWPMTVNKPWRSPAQPLA